MSRSGLKRKSKADSMEEFKMNHKKRGMALIFNHLNFHLPELGTRHGTNKDRDNLRERFQALGFAVRTHDDKTKKEVLEEIRKASKSNHREADCFVCIFMTHGKEGQIYASDGPIMMEEITNPFRGDLCESLVGKPKIFIFQACAGKKREHAVTGMMAGGSADVEEEVQEEEGVNIHTIPAGADFLMCYSVAQGFCSFRHVESGSFYIQDLCEMLQEHGSTMEFTELLTVVNRKVSQRNFNLSKQMPCFTSMLTKRLYFRQRTE